MFVLAVIRCHKLPNKVVEVAKRENVQSQQFVAKLWTPGTDQLHMSR